MTEDDFIARYFVPIAGPAALGLKDDTALYAPPPGCELVLTADAIVAGVHFFPGDEPEHIARKALRVNISDIAAKGAEPQGFLMTFAAPGKVESGWMERFARALGEDAKTYRCPLMGGDTVSTPGPLSISITVIGAVPAGKMVRRAGARAGDAIYVSGTIGDAALGLYVRMPEPPAWVAQLAPEHRDYLASRYLDPQPRLALAPLLREFAYGAMDVSDGLAGDLAKMMKVSGVGADMELERVPFSPAARAAIEIEPPLRYIALTGGDDYEILFTIAAGSQPRLALNAHGLDFPLTPIGNCTGDGLDVRFFDADRIPRQFAKMSFSHL